MNQDKTLSLIHAKIHGIRQIPNYKPSRFETEINILIAEAYENECSECKNKLKAFRLKEELKQLEPPKEQSKFSIGGLFKT